jgi:transcriptional regulator with XRE-family HTH domain
VATAHPSKLRRTFANNVRARRKELGLSQEELADRAQVHRTFVGHVERAETNVSIDNIARISEALEVPPSELLRSE